MTTPSAGSVGVLPAALLAATVPTLLAFHQPPSTTLLNQCLAVALWGGLVAMLAPQRLVRGTLPLLVSLLVVLASVVASQAWGLLPASLAWQAIALLLAAALMVMAGADAASGPRASDTLAALCWGLLTAGMLASGVALVQVFAPGSTDGDWIAHSGLAGRAVGNLRQPNHLCSLLLWALVALVALHELGRLPRALLWALMPLLVFAVELSASRTGAVGLLLLLAWGLVDRRLSRPARIALVAAPLLYAAAYGAMAGWADYSQQALGAGARLAAGDSAAGAAPSPNERPNIWRNALALIASRPWIGVGFGEFNLAWTLTPFPNRPTAFFDHTHNLPLQLMVELGLPWATLVLAGLATALWQGWQRARRAQGDGALVARAALVLVLIAGLHSLVEYPLWYAYFLLPTALAWGLVLGTPRPAQPGRPDRPAGPVPPRQAARRAALGMAAGLVMAVGGALAVLDYQRVVVIYAPTDGSGSLAERIARGQLSPLFAHHADYAAATNEVPPASRALGVARAIHSLLDTRLMMAWARHLAATGRVDEARWLSQRLRDFRNPDAAEFFAPCEAGDRQAFQCQAPERAHDWHSVASLPPRLAPPDAPAGLPGDQPGSVASATQ